MAELESCSDQVGGRKVEERTCDPCKTKDLTSDAVLYCKNCKEFQCKECSKGHDMFKFMKGHELVDVNLIKLLKPSVDLKGLDVCTQHKKQFEFFFVDEDMLCCSHCILECNERGCKKITKLPEEYKTAKTDFQELETDLLQLETSAQTLVRFLQETRDSVGSELELLLDRIEEIKQSVIKKFDEIKATMSETIQRQTTTTTAEIDEKLAESKSVIQTLNDSKNILTYVLENGNDQQKFIARYVIKKQNYVHQSTVKKHLSSIHRPKFSFDRNMQSRILECVDSMTLLHSHTIHVDTATPVKLELVTSVDVKQVDGEEEEPFFSGMDFLPGGRLLVVDILNKKLHVMNGRLEKLGMYQFSYHHYDVAVVSEEEVAVTSGGDMVIEFLHVSNTNTITLTRTITTTVQYFSICLMNETTFLCSTFNDRRPLRMITLTGKGKDFDNLPEKQFGFDDSRSTYIRNRDILVLTDKRNNTVYMYDNKNSGALRCAVKDESIKQPRGVCVGPDDSVFVCSNGTDSIVHVSPSGRVIGSHKLEITFPFTVCMSKNGKTLAITNNANGERKLKLYHISAT